MLLKFEKSAKPSLAAKGSAGIGLGVGGLSGRGGAGLGGGCLLFLGGSAGLGDSARVGA